MPVIGDTATASALLQHKPTRHWHRPRARSVNKVEALVWCSGNPARCLGSHTEKLKALTRGRRRADEATRSLARSYYGGDILKRDVRCSKPTRSNRVWWKRTRRDILAKHIDIERCMACLCDGDINPGHVHYQTPSRVVLRAANLDTSPL